MKCLEVDFRAAKQNDPFVENFYKIFRTDIANLFQARKIDFNPETLYSLLHCLTWILMGANGLLIRQGKKETGIVRLAMRELPDNKCQFTAIPLDVLGNPLFSEEQCPFLIYFADETDLYCRSLMAARSKRFITEGMVGMLIVYRI